MDKSVNSGDSLLQEVQHEMFVQLLPMIVFSAFSCLVGILGNCLALVFYISKCKQTTTVILIIFLAFVDLIVCILIIPKVFEMAVNIEYSQKFMCKMTQSLSLWAVAISCFTLWMIAIDRHRKICKPFAKQITVSSLKYIVAVIVVFSLAIAGRNILIYDIVSVSATSTHSNRTVTGHYCTVTDDPGSRAIVSGFFTLDFLLILMIWITIIVTYTHALINILKRRLRKKASKFRDESGNAYNKYRKSGFPQDDVTNAENSDWSSYIESRDDDLESYKGYESSVVKEQEEMELSANESALKHPTFISELKEKLNNGDCSDDSLKGTTALQKDSQERAASFQKDDQERTPASQKNIKEKTATFRKDNQEKTPIFKKNSQEMTASIQKVTQERTATFRNDNKEGITRFQKNSQERIASFQKEIQERTAAFRKDNPERITTFQRSIQERTSAFRKDDQEGTTTFQRDIQERTAAFRKDNPERITTFQRDIQERTAAFRIDEQERTTTFQRDIQERTAAFRKDDQERTTTLQKEKTATLHNPERKITLHKDNPKRTNIVQRDTSNRTTTFQKMKRRAKRVKFAAIRNPLERNLTIMMFAASLIFIFCFLPYFVIRVLMRITLRKEVSYELSIGIQFLLKCPFLNSVLNPVIYCIFNPKFRKYIKSTICRW